MNRLPGIVRICQEQLFAVFRSGGTISSPCNHDLEQPVASAGLDPQSGIPASRVQHANSTEKRFVEPPEADTSAAQIQPE